MSTYIAEKVDVIAMKRMLKANAVETGAGGGGGADDGGGDDGGAPLFNDDVRAIKQHLARDFVEKYKGQVARGRPEVDGIVARARDHFFARVEAGLTIVVGRGRCTCAGVVPAGRSRRPFLV